MLKSKNLSVLKWVALIVASTTCGGIALAGSPVVAFSQDGLTVSQVTPGSSVALLSVAREPENYITRLAVYRELLTDEDRDGVVKYELPRGVAFSSIWIVVDIASGEFVMASPAGFMPMELVQRSANRGKAVEAIANSLDIGRARVEVLVVRPGVAAWSSSIREGMGADSDKKKDRRVRVDLKSLRALKAPANPVLHSLQRGDVVAIIDPELMQYWAQRIE